MTKRSRYLRKADIAHLVRAATGVGVLSLSAMAGRATLIGNPNAPAPDEVDRRLAALSGRPRAGRS